MQKRDAAQTSKAGGWGIGCTLKRSDLLMIQRALRQGWPIPDDTLRAIREQLRSEIKTCKTHTFLRLAETILMMTEVENSDNDQAPLSTFVGR